MTPYYDPDTPEAWYRRNYPKGPDHDPRCLRVLVSWEALYNIVRTGRGRCTLRAADCGWHNDCTRHHPQAEQAAG